MFTTLAFGCLRHTALQLLRLLLESLWAPAPLRMTVCLSDVPRRKCSAATLYRQLQPNETKHIAYAQTLQRFVFVQTQAYIFHFWSIKLLNFYLELVILKTVTPSVSPCCVIVSAALPFSYDKSVCESVHTEHFLRLPENMASSVTTF